MNNAKKNSYVKKQITATLIDLLKKKGSIRKSVYPE